MNKTLTFNEYYKYYLTLHSNRHCRQLHFFGQIATILFVFYIFNNSFWILLPITPFVVYPFAWAGHFFFEKNKPAAFSNPFWAKACDWLMFRDIILRRIKL